MSGDKVLPKRLEDELNDAKLYKRSSTKQETPAQLMAKVFDDSKERAMYDEILGPMMGNRNKSSLSSGAPVFGSSKSGSNSNAAAGAGAGADFNTTILTRLKLVEQEAKENRSKLAAQVTENQRLKEENRLLKSMTTEPSGMMKEVAALKQENEALQTKISDMEIFLGDYGLVWVGKTDGMEVGDDDEEKNHDREGERFTPKHTVPFSKFKYHIDELNAVVYSEPAQILTETNGGGPRKARLVNASELLQKIRVVYYKNGLLIKRGPLRSCGSRGYKTFVKDICDGYFPSEFQAEYPDGVIFDLKDMHETVYVEEEEGAQLEVDSNHLGGGGGGGGGGVGTTMGDTGTVHGRWTREQFLNRLPKTVIRKGQVIGMRKDMEDVLSERFASGPGGASAGGGRAAAAAGASDKKDDEGASRSEGSVPTAAAGAVPVSVGGSTSSTVRGFIEGGRTYIETPATLGEKDGVSSGETMGKMVHIQVKWIDRSTVYAKMHEHNTIGDLKLYLTQHFQLDRNVATSYISSSSHCDAKQSRGTDTTTSATIAAGSKALDSQDSSNSGSDDKSSSSSSSSSDPVVSTGSTIAALPSVGADCKDTAVGAALAETANRTVAVETMGTGTCTSAAAAGSDPIGFELRSAYPPRALGMHLTLQEAQLVPNGTVHARQL